MTYNVFGGTLSLTQSINLMYGKTLLVAQALLPDSYQKLHSSINIRRNNSMKTKFTLKMSDSNSLSRMRRDSVSVLTGKSTNTTITTRSKTFNKFQLNR